MFETEVLVLDDLGSVRPTEWRWDTVRLILNTRYNDSRTTIITTNFADEPAAKASGDPTMKAFEDFATPEPAAREKYKLGDRIGERNAFPASRDVPSREDGRAGLPKEVQERELRMKIQRWFF